MWPEPALILFRLTLICLMLPGSLVAQITINWGTGISFGRIVESDGSTIPSPANGFSYEIGTFGSFVPTESNIDQWAANWHVFDGDPNFFQLGSTNYGLYFDSAGLSSSQKTNSNYSGADTSYTFSPGQQAYVWVFNNNDYNSINTSTEWALYTQLIDGSSTIDKAWQMPNASSSTTTRSWFVSSADTAVWGGVDSGSDVGGGNIVSTPSSYHVQTAGFTAGVFWDINGSTAGATNNTTTGTAAGTWNSSNTNWSRDPTGNIATGAFTSYKVATFAASDPANPTRTADGAYTVTKVGTANVFGLDFRDGTVTIGHGSGGLINFDTNGKSIAFSDGQAFDGLVDTAFINVYENHTATIRTAIASSQDVNLTGGGTLVLAGTQTGQIDGTLALQSGTLQMSGTGSNPRLGFNSGGQTTISIEGGTLLISENATTKASDVQFGSTTDVVFTNGSIVVGQSYESLGTLSLTLSEASTIDFTGSSTSSIIAFDDSSGIDWSGSDILEVTNWDGIPLNLGTGGGAGTGGGGTDQFYIGANEMGLTQAQLDKIKFINPIGLPAGIYDAYILSTGEIVPGVIPEPSTYACGALLLLLGAFDFYRRRKR